MAYARGTFASQCCDRCGFVFPYGTLQKESDTRWLVCEDCLDGPDPRRRLRAKPVRTALRHLRPLIGGGLTDG